MEEIVRRLRNSRAKNLRYLKESLPVHGINEEDEEDEEEIVDEVPEEDFVDDSEAPEMGDPDMEEPLDDEEPENDTVDPEDPDAMDDNSDKENTNPLDNPYAVSYKLGDSVVMAYANGTKSKLEGVIDGYDKEGFYRIKWSSGMTTNGITDIALADIVDSIEESKCVCGSKKFINESSKLVCDRCGRVLKEFKDPLSVADRSRPKDKKLVRSEAHPTSTVIKPDISESIKKAFSKSSTKKVVNEEVESPYFDYLQMKLEGEFWTRSIEMKDDIEELGYTVDEINAEYVVVYGEDEDGEEHTIQIPIGGTSRTMTLDFSRARQL